jgi:hypothetical protein
LVPSACRISSSLCLLLVAKTKFIRILSITSYKGINFLKKQLKKNHCG